MQSYRVTDKVRGLVDIMRYPVMTADQASDTWYGGADGTTLDTRRGQGIVEAAVMAAITTAAAAAASTAVEEVESACSCSGRRRQMLSGTITELRLSHNAGMRK